VHVRFATPTGSESKQATPGPASWPHVGRPQLRVLRRRSQWILAEAGSTSHRTWLFDPSGEVELLVELLASRVSREQAVRDFVAHRDGAADQEVWSALRKLDDLARIGPAPTSSTAHPETKLELTGVLS